jgi:hypothetical protein
MRRAGAVCSKADDVEIGVDTSMTADQGAEHGGVAGQLDGAGLDELRASRWFQQQPNGRRVRVGGGELGVW